MNEGAPNQYFDSHVAEIYDQFETETDDVELIRRLLGGGKTLRILEPFCGTGRIMLPLAADGHELTGLDQSPAMLERARAKLAGLPEDVRKRVSMFRANVTRADWPKGFDVVILGGNCFYELSSPEEQEGCIASAAASLREGGHVYVDNDHMEGELHELWRRPGVRKTVFPTGVCADGTRLEGTTETLWFDAPKRLCRARRTITMTRPDGTRSSYEYVHQKHPVSAGEVRGWFAKYGFSIEADFGDRAGSTYVDASPRAIFWARKEPAPAERQDE